MKNRVNQIAHIDFGNLLSLLKVYNYEKRNNN